MWSGGVCQGWRGPKRAYPATELQGWDGGEGLVGTVAVVFLSEDQRADGNTVLFVFTETRAAD